jgi:hypothetical protein
MKAAERSDRTLIPESILTEMEMLPQRSLRLPEATFSIIIDS